MPELLPFDWEGFDDPEYTQVPDTFFDVLLPHLGDAELRVLLYLIRRTFGFKKRSDRVSLGQLVNGITTREGKILDSGCGLTRTGAQRGIKGLVAKGIISAQHNSSPERGNEPTTYAIRMRGVPYITEKHRGATQEIQGISPTDIALANQSGPQETGVQETEQETEDSNARPLPKSGGMTTIRRRVNTEGEGTAPPAARPRPAPSPYIAGVIEDISRDLGDLDHSNSNITQALRLWQEAGLDEAEFVALLREVKGTVRHYQAGGIGNRMAYFFQTLRDRLSKQDGPA